MKQKLKNIFRKHYVNLMGWRTDRKIVVIESDDWGAERMPSVDILHKLQRMGYNTNLCHYVSNDALASETDLRKLFKVLSGIVNINGNNPVITANTIMANPDFDRIRESGFREYSYRWFTESLNQYPEHKNSLARWKEGINKGIFYPQLHGREHLQVIRWLRDLKNGVGITKKSFDLGFYGISTPLSDGISDSYLAAFDVENRTQQSFILNSIQEAAYEFKNIFGYISRSAIAPNYTWNNEVEKAMDECGVRYLQGGTVQHLPIIENGRRPHIRHSVGDKNESGQIYLVRNCTFEPSSDRSKDWVKSCMEEIDASFFWKKPAIIESHRVNYIGYIHPENRDRNLIQLQYLLELIVKKWPDVEFMTSDQLGDVIHHSREEKS